MNATPDAVPHAIEPVSPRLGDAALDAYGALPQPEPHTEAELAAVVRLVATLGSSSSGRGNGSHGLPRVAVGHGRDAASRAAASAFVAAWHARCGSVEAVVHWPEAAASWLRPARRLTAPAPDAWVLAAAPRGAVQLVRRLRRDTDWDPERTVAFAALADSRLPVLAEPPSVDGLVAVGSDGVPCRFRGRWLTTV